MELEYLIISYCASLVALPEGVSSLVSLTDLDIRDCSSLAFLPEGLRGLTALTSILLEGCPAREAWLAAGEGTQL